MSPGSILPSRRIRLPYLLPLLLLTAGCVELTVEQQRELGIPLNTVIGASARAQTDPEGTDPVILNTLFDLLRISDKIKPDLAQAVGTPFGDMLSVGSPTGYVLRNRHLHPGVPLAEALAQKKDPAMHERLVELARWERSDEVRSTALVALALMRNEKDLFIFQEAVAHLNSSVRFGTMEALRVWGHPEKAKVILKAAAENDVQPLLRVYAAAGMAQLKDPDGLVKLRAFLESSDWMLRAMAARYIGDFGEAKDYELMLNRIDREQTNDFVMAEHCIAALKLFAKQEP